MLIISLTRLGTNLTSKLLRRKMGDSCVVRTGVPLNVILEKLENFAPLSLAEKWDNVGLLVDPFLNSPVRSILLTNDLTEDVVEEAKAQNSELIITYHPNIFQGLKSVSQRTWKERIVVECIKNGIAVFSPHTSWDAVTGGVNDWLGGSFQDCTSKPLLPNDTNPLQGAGRFLELSVPLSMSQIVDKIKKHIEIPHLRLAIGKSKNKESLVKTVALCAGSGASVLKGVTADLYLTGEMLHHDILEATQNGTHVLLTNHSDSERGFLKYFKSQLQTNLLEDKVNVFVSKIDCDPLVTV